MVRFEYTRKVHHYSFQPPESISELEYNSYKQMLLINPNSDITPTDNSKKKNSFLYVLTIVGVILLIIGLATTTWIIVFLSIFLILHPIVNTGVLQSSINQDRATNTKSEFYNDLKRMILNSRSYSDFYASYKNKYSPLHKNPYS
jgi:hypothetical protein